ncbi:hypothetical protein [Blastococcus sp. TF02A-26]|nr:hypothetical protein [Blastococcus sp. TF02A-26]
MELPPTALRGTAPGLPLVAAAVTVAVELPAPVAALLDLPAGTRRLGARP